MPLNADISTALHLLEHVQERVEDCDDPKLQMHMSQDLKALIALLEDPVFRSIVTIQDSLTELNTQLGQHPSILPGDFDINLSGKLELSLPNTPAQPLGPNVYQDLNQDTSELEDQRVPVAQFVHSSSEDTSAQVTSPSLVSDDMGMPPITTPTYAKEFQKVIEAAAKGRQVYTVQLYKPEGTSLGFSVVGLRSKDKGELGIFLQEIQPNGIAGCDGRLVEGDQILAIDGQPLDSNISHEQAISILQKARGLVELVVARSAQDVGSSLPTDELSGASSSTAAAGGAISVIGGAGVTCNQAHSDRDQSLSISSIVTPVPTTPSLSSTTTAAATSVPTPTPTPTPTPISGFAGGLVVERSPSAVSDNSKTGSDMVLNTEWAQVEVINLINDGSGLGFGIIGGRSTGVVVKTILPGGVADRDNRLQSGDHILQIGDVNLRGMGSEQVAAVLRQSGTHVRLVVARPVEPTSPDYQALGSHAPIVPTKILGDPDELERHLVHSVPETYNSRHLQGDSSYDNGYAYSQEPDIEMHARPGLIMDVVRNPVPISAVPVIPAVPIPAQIQNLPILSMDSLGINSLPEMERFTVELKKDIYGLGITIAGYVCEKEELSGIFVKSISEGSAADMSNKIQINDRIVEVDGHSLQGYSNHEAVEVLRSTGQMVILCLERYLRGPKYEQLQQAIAASELRPPQPGSPSITSLPSFPISADGETTTEIEPEGESHTTVDSAVLREGDRENLFDDLDEATNVEALLSDPSSELTPQIRAAIKTKWQKIVGPDTEIVVAQLKKFAEGSGLGISLEGTVDVEDGQEVRPHHYIRSILPEGPVGQNGILRSGDELLEVNGYRLLGINHMEVVSVLKELPIHVRMVCGRNTSSQDPLCPIDTAQHQAAFQTRSILGGSLQNLLPAMDRLVKAKSDGSLASTTTTATVTDASLSKMKSRSLEPLTGLAMWSSEPQIIELIKGERGLGFSILDYQDPMNPNETVIVIRSLVPGGVAQVDGQLIPGDRLLFVNDIALENATLDQAVQALKGAPKGTVRIGVAKPLPIPDSIAQLVTPVCIVRRTRSLPDDSEATDRAINFDDFPSSRSGISCSSTDRQEADDIDEVEYFEDASPITPVHSPKKSPIPSPFREESSEMSSPSAVVPQASLEKDTAPPTDSVVPSVDETVIREKQSGPARPDPEPSSVIATLATVEPREDTTTCGALLSLKLNESKANLEKIEEGTLLDEKVVEERLVQEEEHARIREDIERARDTIVKDTGPSTSYQKVALDAGKKDTQGQSDLVKKKVQGTGKKVERVSSKCNYRGTILKSRETIQEKSTVKKEEKKKSVKRTEELSKKVEKKVGKSAKSQDDSSFGPVFKVERTSVDEQLVNVQVKEEEQRGTTKETSENARKLAKERRRSLKEQESIDRVTKFLTEQSASSGFERKTSVKESCQSSKQRSNDETTNPSTTRNSEEDSGRKYSLAVDSGASASAERRKSLTKQENVETVLESQVDLPLESDCRSEAEHEFADKSSSRRNLEKVSSCLEDQNAAESSKKVTGRRSSMKKRENSRSFDKEGNKVVSPADGLKKEVKIQDNVEEIFYEDVQDQVSTLPEVQLVKARIISMEEAAASLIGRTIETRVEFPPEVANVLDKVEARSKAVTAIVSAEDSDRGLQLQLPGLSKSASEIVLAVVSEEEENKISEKNIKPEILLDLSKVLEEGEVPVSSNVIRNVTGSTKEKWILNRVNSEGSEKFLEVKSLVACHSSPVDDERVSNNSSEPLGDGALSLTAQSESVTGVNEDVGANVGDIAAADVPLDVTSGERVRIDDSESLSEAADCVERSSEEKPSTLKTTQTVREKRKDSSIDEDPRSLIAVHLENSNKNPAADVIAKTLCIAKSDLPARKTECIYKSVDQRLRENSIRNSTAVSKSTDSLSLKRQFDDPKSSTSVEKDIEDKQFLTTDREAEEQHHKALERQREHEKFLQIKRSLIESDVYVKQAEDGLIGQQHSLQYQSQTLETRSKHFTASTSFEDLLESIPESRSLDLWTVRGFEDYSTVADRSPLRNKREAETQTHQETKSTQCGPDGSLDSPLESTEQSVHEFYHNQFSDSPRREVQTQTQGESKSTQCYQDDLGESALDHKQATFHNESSTPCPRDSARSPRKEVQVQTEQESKSVQCIPEDIPDSPLKSSIFFRRSLSQSQKSLDSLRREVEVQTYQETKSTQCSSDEFSESPQKILLKRVNRPYTLITSQSSQVQRSIDSPSFTFDSSESSVNSSPRKFPIIVLVEGRTDMTVTHNYRDRDGNVVWAKHWGPERLVEIYREPKSSLGLSIVGGKVDLYNGGPNKTQNISGIFIKNVLPNSPAGRTGELKTGDRIIEVDGIDLRNSTHERAVEAIQAAGNPVCLLVQSLVHLSSQDERQMQEDERDGDRGFRRQSTRNHEIFVGNTSGTPTASLRHKPLPVSPARTITPELIQEGIEDAGKPVGTRSDLKRQSIKKESDGAGPSSRRCSMKKSLRKGVQSPPKNPGILREVSEERDDQPTQKEVTSKQKYSSDESSDEEDTRDLEGNVYTKAGIEISRKSAGNVKRTKEEIEADPEQEDEFGYTSKKIKKRYDCLGHTVVMVKLEKDRRGLGISLAGHKDRNRMAVFVCGLNPKGVAHKTGGLHIGDEILEVNGTVLQGRCHLNASALIKGMPGPCFKVIVLRRSSAVNDLAVKPIVQFPPTLDEDDANRFSQYKGVHTVSIKKGQYGLGIMIIEGKHAEVGQGIFVSDIQEGSAAEQAGLQVGDMILAVNLDSLLGSSYDEATGLLKKTEGVVTLTVCNPNQSKLAKEEEEKSKRSSEALAPEAGDQTKLSPAKEPEKPKEPEPPKDPKDCEISIGKETTIEYPKDKDKGIGFSIVGGSDTPLGGVVIVEVFPDGAAGKDGRLKAGDQIIEMCHESFKTIEHAKAHEAILKASGTIHMVVFRDDKPAEEYDVELQKKSGKGAGLCLTGYKSGKGAYVSDILPGGSAMECGKIVKGDRVITVCGQDVREASVEDIAFHMKVSNPVQLKLARYKPAKQ